MDSLKDEKIVNIKVEEVCRTCLTDGGHFFNISDIFDHYTLTQMIQNITNLQIDPLDGYTQSICFQCVKEVRRANQFRTKCLQSNDAFVKQDTKTFEVPTNVYETAKSIKKEIEDSCDVLDCCSETEDICKSESSDNESDLDNNADLCTKNKEKHDEKTRKTNVNNRSIIFDCPLCRGLFSSDIIYEKHKNEFHADRLANECFKQKHEPLGFVLKKKYSKEIKCVYKCALDDFLGKTFLDFKNHWKQHAGEKPIICDECGFRTTEISLLKKHRVYKHVQEKKFFCSLCNYSCQTSGELKNHLHSHTTEKKYQCDLCEMKFKSASAVYRHKRVKHEKKKSYVCHICQKAYFHNTELKLHMLTHTGERPNVCHHCGKGFARITSLKCHVARKHDPTTTLLKCDRCDYSTKNKSELKHHIMRHNGEKPFKCPQCPFSCLLSHSLKLHIRRHSGQKNFSCNLCDYKSFASHEVMIHKRIHTGEKPYHCTICNNHSSATRGKLKSHMQTHSTELKFECPKCPYKTNVQVMLRRHIKKNRCMAKRGRRPSKHQNAPNNIFMNDEIKEDTTESINVLSNNIV